MRRGLGSLLVAALLLAAVLPAGALASGHEGRYVVFGRVLDEHGLPAAELTVSIDLAGTDAPTQAKRTNCLGDFVAGFSVGDVEGAEIEIRTGGFVFKQAVDPVVRRTFVPITIPGTFEDDACREHRDTFHERHTVTGRVLDADGVLVGGEQVNVTLRLGDGSRLSATQVTSEAGEFSLGFQAPAIQQGGVAEVSVRDQAWTVPMDSTYELTVANQELEPPPEGAFPWGNVLLVVVTLLAVLLAVGVVYFVLHGRRRFGGGSGDHGEGRFKRR